MRVAVAVENDMVISHLGQTTSFKIYEVEQKLINRTYFLPAFGEGHEAMVSILQEMKANVLICGGIGAEAKKALGAAGILVFGGIIGKADDAVRLLIEGTLQSASNSQCSGQCEGHCSACAEGHCNNRK